MKCILWIQSIVLKFKNFVVYQRKKVELQNFESGFTLLEMIIAIAVFSILSLMAYGIVNQLIRSDEFIEEKSQQLNQLSKVLLILEQDFGFIVPRSIRKDLTLEQESMLLHQTSRNKDEDTITFTRNSWFNPQMLLNRSTLQRVSYKIENENLIREYYEYTDRLVESSPKSQILLNDVSSLGFKFLNKNEWQDTWTNEKELPRAIEIRLTTKKEGEIKRIFIIQ